MQDLGALDVVADTVLAAERPGSAWTAWTASARRCSPTTSPPPCGGEATVVRGRSTASTARAPSGTAAAGTAQGFSALLRLRADAGGAGLDPFRPGGDRRYRPRCMTCRPTGPWTHRSTGPRRSGAGRRRDLPAAARAGRLLRPGRVPRRAVQGDVRADVLRDGAPPTRTIPRTAATRGPGALPDGAAPAGAAAAVDLTDVAPRLVRPLA